MQGLPMVSNCHLLTGQKQQSGGWNPGAVANAMHGVPSPTATASLDSMPATDKENLMGE